MIYLLSDLCLSRNYIAIDILSSIYPLNLCIEILGNPTYGFELRTCFTKLIQTLWIDRAPYNRLLLPDNVKVWQDIDVGSKPKFPTSAHDII